MSRPLRILTATAAVIIVLLISVIGAALALIDPNDYRDDIATGVEDATGRQLRIDGDLSLNFFPWIGVSVGQTTLGNAPGFGPEPMLRVAELGVAVRLMPLFSKRIEIDTVYLDGLQLHLKRKADGSSNWDDLAKDKPEPEPEPEPKPASGFDIANASVASVRVSDAALHFLDEQAGSRYSIENVELTTGELRQGAPITLTLSFVASASAPAVRSEVRIDTTATPNEAGDTVTLAPLNLTVAASGDGVPGGSQELKLDATVRYERNAGTATISDSTLRAAGLTAKLDASARGIGGEAMSYSGGLRVSEFSPRGLMQRLGMTAPRTADESVLNRASAELAFEGTPSSLKVSELRAGLDDTALDGTLAVTDFANQAVRFNLNLDGIDADRYLPPDNGGKGGKDTGGSGSLNEIRIPAETLDAINAEGTVKVASLKLKGVRLEQLVATIKARNGQPKTQELRASLYGGELVETSRLVPGKPPRYATTVKLSSVRAGDLLQDYLGKDHVSGVATLVMDLNSAGHTVGDLRKGLNGTLSLNLADGAVKGYNLAHSLRKARAAYKGETLESDAPQQTDFANIAMSANIVNGVLKTDDISAKNPLLRLTGSGQVDLFAETLDLVAKPVVVETSKGQGGADLAELEGIPIPLRISGALSDPKIKLDLEGALKAQLKAKAKEELKKEEDKLKDKLGDFLRKGGGRARAPPGPGPRACFAWRGAAGCACWRWRRAASVRWRSPVSRSRARTTATACACRPCSMPTPPRLSR